MNAIPAPRPGGIAHSGKRMSKCDARNLMFASLLQAPPLLPAEPVCVTRGTKQQMSRALLAKCCDEAYAIIDAVDIAKLRERESATAWKSLVSRRSPPVSGHG